MKILFISHSYPPILGGVENQNFYLSKGLEKITPTKIIANKKGKWWLPIFIPVTFLRAFFLMTTYDVCLLGNGVLAPIGAVLKFFHPKKKFFCVIHGLDVNFGQKKGFLPKVYQAVNLPSIKKMDGLFAVGNTTVEEAKKAGVEENKITFIPNGVHANELKEEHGKKELEEIFGKKLEGKKVIFRLGRFVKHKGTSWFIENIMPELGENIVMIAAGGRVAKGTAGDKDDFLNCEKAIIENRLQDRVRLVPSIPQKDLKVILNTANLVVSPNVKVPGTMEGFGINAIEAAACERVVIASNLEGLADAIKNGENGFLVEPENKDLWIKKINAVLDAGDDFLREFGKKAGKYVEENYSWDKICLEYLEKMKK